MRTCTHATLLKSFFRVIYTVKRAELSRVRIGNLCIVILIFTILCFKQRWFIYRYAGPCVHKMKQLCINKTRVDVNK